MSDLVIQPRKNLALSLVSLITSPTPLGLVGAITTLVRVHLNKKEKLKDKHDKVSFILSVIAIVISLTATCTFLIWNQYTSAPWKVVEHDKQLTQITSTITEQLDPLTNMVDENKAIVNSQIQSSFAAYNITGLDDFGDWLLADITYTIDDVAVNNTDAIATVSLTHRDVASFNTTLDNNIATQNPTTTDALRDIIRQTMNTTGQTTDTLELTLTKSNNTYSLTNDSISNLAQTLYGNI